MITSTPPKPHPKKSVEECYALYTSYAPAEVDALRQQRSAQNGEVRALYAKVIEGKSAVGALAAFTGDAGRRIDPVGGALQSVTALTKAYIPTSNEGPKITRAPSQPSLTYSRAIGVGVLHGIVEPVVFVAKLGVQIIAHPGEVAHAVVEAPVTATRAIVSAVEKTVIHPVTTSSQVIQAVKDVNDMPGPEKTEKGVAFITSLCVPAFVFKAVKSALRARGQAEFNRVVSCEQVYLQQMLDIVRRARSERQKEIALDRIEMSLPAPAKADSLAHFVSKHQVVEEVRLGRRADRVFLQRGPRSVIRKGDDLHNVLSEMLSLNTIAKQQPKHFSLPEFLGVCVDDRMGQPYFFTADLPGISFDDLLRTAKSTSRYEGLKEACTALGRAHAELHSMLQVKIPPREANWCASLLVDNYREVNARIGRLKFKSPYTAAEIRELALHEKQGPRIVSAAHPDPHFGNFLWDSRSKRISLLDFEQEAGLESPFQLSRRHPGEALSALLDEVHLCCYKLAIPTSIEGALIESFLEGYRSLAHPRLSKDVIRYWHVNGLYERLLWCSWETESIPEQVSIVTRFYTLLEREKRGL